MVRRALLLSVVTSYGGLVANFATVVLSSWFLTPGEAGVYVVCLAFFTIISMLAEFNIVNFGIQSKEHTKGIAGSMYGLALVINITTVVMLYIFSVPFSSFLGGSVILPTYWIMALSLLVFPFTVPTVSRLRRDLNYVPIMVSTLLGSAARLLVAFALLTSGWGVECLALAYAAGRFVEGICIVVYGKNEVLTRPSASGWREIVKFSSINTMAQAAGTMGFAVAEIATGAFLGLHYAGLYNRGSTLTNVYRTGVERSIYPIALASLAAEHRSETGKVHEKLLHGLDLMTAVGWPAFIVLFAIAPEAIRIIFGDDWAGAIPVTQILCVACAVYIFSSLTPGVLIATNNSAALLRRELTLQGTRIVLVLVGVQFGIEGVAYAVLAAYALAVVIDLRLFRQLVGLKPSAVVRRLMRSGMVALSVIFALWIIGALLPHDSSMLAKVAALAVTGLVTWIGALAISKHPLMVEVAGMLRRPQN